jgi:hypothetical protein
MFQHVTVLVSFIFAIALTHVFSSASQLLGWKPNDWVGAELLGLLLAVCAVLAGWAKPRWLQWVGVGGMFVQNICFFVFYTLGS